MEPAGVPHPPPTSGAAAAKGKAVVVGIVCTVSHDEIAAAGKGQGLATGHTDSITRAAAIREKSDGPGVLNRSLHGNAGVAAYGRDGECAIYDDRVGMPARKTFRA